MDFYAEMVKQFADNAPAGVAEASKGGSGATEGGWTGNAQSQGNAVRKAKSFDQAMFESHPDSIKRERVTKAFLGFVQNHMKLGTSDIGPLLATSIAPQMTFVRNEETPIKNLCEQATGPELVVDDMVWRTITAYQGLGRRASRVNMEAPLSTASVQPTFQESFNALSFYGDPVSTSFIASAQAEQQRGLDTLKFMIDSELLAINKAINYDTWNGQIQTSFAPDSIPQFRGILQACTQTAGLSGLGIGAAAIETVLANNLVPYVGHHTQKVLFVTDANSANIRSIEIARYGGNNPVAYAQSQAVLAARFAEYKIPVSRVFEPANGPPIPAVVDVDLVALAGGNNAVLLTIDPQYMPRYAYFHINGEVGPWMFVRPNYNLFTTVFVAHGLTLNNPAPGQTQYAWTDTE